MSATNRGALRAPNDFYATPATAIAPILKVLAPCIEIAQGIVEPCAGDGAILRAIEPMVGAQSFVHAIEIDRTRFEKLAFCLNHKQKSHCEDFLAMAPDRFEPNIDLVITNPPYGLAIEFIKKSIEIAPAGLIVFLLRLNFLEGLARAPFLREHAPDVYVLPRRPSFTGKGTDATAYAWFVWQGRAVRTSGRLEVLDQK